MSQWERLFHSYAQPLAAIGVGCIFGTSMLPQTLGLGHYRSVMASFRAGEEMPVDEKVQVLTQRVLQQINLTETEEASIDFFSGYDHSPSHKGSTGLSTGAIVGIPSSFRYNTVEDIDKDSITINRQVVNWGLPFAGSLVDSMVLSERAKQFGIAREICYVDTSHVMVDGMLKVAFSCSAYTTGFMLNNIFNLKKIMKRWGRINMYIGIGAAFYFLYLVTGDQYYCYRDRKVDKRAADLGVEYAEGGVEFYDKWLQRNKAMYFLLPKAGPKRFTLYGNEVMNVLRRPTLPLTERKDNLDKIVAELREVKLDSHDAENLEGS